jgi:hypothetical protein
MTEPSYSFVVDLLELASWQVHFPAEELQVGQLPCPAVEFLVELMLMAYP